jgi:hypothetical protein
MPNIWKFFRGRIGSSLDYFPTVSLIIIGIFIIFYLVFYRKDKRLFIYALFILIAFAYRYGLSRIELPIEKVHFLEYGFLSFLVFRALHNDVKNKLLYPLSALIVFCLGFLDEGIQYLLPNRVYEFRDVMLNATSGVLGLCVVAFLFKK